MLTRQNSYSESERTFQAGTPNDNESNDIRTTNLSKLSMHSNKTKITTFKLNSNKNDNDDSNKKDVDPHSL